MSDKLKDSGVSTTKLDDVWMQNRKHILDFVAKKTKERGVTWQREIVKSLGLHQVTVMKHLAQLEKDGLITIEDTGTIKLIRTKRKGI